MAGADTSQYDGTMRAGRGSAGQGNTEAQTRAWDVPRVRYAACACACWKGKRGGGVDLLTARQRGRPAGQ